MDDVLSITPPPSRFFEEELDNFAAPSPFLPSPFLVLNPNPNPSLLRLSLLVVSMSSPSLALLHRIPSKSRIGTLILPKIPLSENQTPSIPSPVTDPAASMLLGSRLCSSQSSSPSLLIGPPQSVISITPPSIGPPQSVIFVLLRPLPAALHLYLRVSLLLQRYFHLLLPRRRSPTRSLRPPRKDQSFYPPLRTLRQSMVGRMHRSASTMRTSNEFLLGSGLALAARGRAYLSPALRSTMEIDHLPAFEGSNAEKEAHRFRIVQSSIHLIPLVLIFCAFVLWIFSDSQSNAGKKEAHHFRIVQSNIHLIPVVLIFCAFMLWIFSSPCA